MSKHTPGPWVIKRDTGLRQRIQSASGGTLANMTSRPLPYGANFSHEQISANASLIAAAPELLEALEAMLAASMADGYEGMREATWKARAALAKASP